MTIYLSPTTATGATNTGTSSAVGSGDHESPSTSSGKEELSTLITVLSTAGHFTYLQLTLASTGQWKSGNQGMGTGMGTETKS